MGWEFCPEVRPPKDFAAGSPFCARDPAWPDLWDLALIERAEDWLRPLLTGVRRLADLKAVALDGAVRTLLPWDLQRSLEGEAPARWTPAPTGKFRGRLHR